MIGETERAYLAGLFDGEGCIYMQERLQPGQTRFSYTIGIQLSMTDPSAVRLFHQAFGGRFYNMAGRKAWHRPLWSWWLGMRGASDFLHSMLPYLQVKKPQAQLALEFIQFQAARRRGGLHGGPRSPEIVATQKQFYERMKALKKEIY